MMAARPSPSGSSPIWGGSEFVTFNNPANGEYSFTATINFPTSGRAHIEAWFTGLSHPSADEGDGMFRQNININFTNARTVRANTGTYYNITAVADISVEEGEQTITFRLQGSHDPSTQIQWGYAVILTDMEGGGIL